MPRKQAKNNVNSNKLVNKQLHNNNIVKYHTVLLTLSAFFYVKYNANSPKVLPRGGEFFAGGIKSQVVFTFILTKLLIKINYNKN